MRGETNSRAAMSFAETVRGDAGGHVLSLRPSKQALVHYFYRPPRTGGPTRSVDFLHPVLWCGRGVHITSQRRATPKNPRRNDIQLHPCGARPLTGSR